MNVQNIEALTEAVNQILAQQREMLARIEALEKMPAQLAAAFTQAAEIPMVVTSGTPSAPSGAPTAAGPAR